LTVGTNLANNLANLGLETHVKHTISLVKNQVGNTTKVGLASLEHIDETTRCGDANLDTTCEVTNLRSLGDTSVDASVANAGGLSELADFGLNLNSQLTSRRKNQNDGAVTGSEERLGVDVNDSGQAVGEGLSGTSLSDTNNVASRESHGPSLALNRCGLSETLCLDLVHHIWRETGLVELCDRLGDVGALDGNLVFLAESLDFFGGAVGNSWVLLVEGLLELGHSVEVPLLLLETRTKLAHTIAAAATTAVTTTAAAVAASTTTVATSTAGVATATTARVAAAAAARVAATVDELAWATEDIVREEGDSTL
jgi:hypothetical protein